MVCFRSVIVGNPSVHGKEKTKKKSAPDMPAEILERYMKHKTLTKGMIFQINKFVHQTYDCTQDGDLDHKFLT